MNQANCPNCGSFILLYCGVWSFVLEEIAAVLLGGGFEGRPGRAYLEKIDVVRPNDVGGCGPGWAYLCP